MIRKAQIKFIAIIMSILLGVFGIVFAVLYNITLHLNEQNIEQSLEDIRASFLVNANEHIHSKTIIALIRNVPDGQQVASVLTFDEDTFTKEQSQQIVQTALERAYITGKISTVYYKFFEGKTNEYILVATDASDSIAVFKARTIDTMLSLIVTCGVLFFVVIALSKSIFKPLRDAFTKQKQFIANASHELKTPLSIISANADVLMSENDSKWVNNIKSQTNRMNDLIQDMLSLAKIDEDKIKLLREKFNVSDEVNEVALAFDAVAFEKNKNLQLFIKPDIFYVGDKQSLKQILSILLDNAVKHADENGQIVVELKKENGRISLSVFNTGSNIPAENANKIFERFYRGDHSRSRESGGSGLGLSIAKSIADANNWKISATSIPDQSMLITLII